MAWTAVRKLGATADKTPSSSIIHVISIPAPGDPIMIGSIIVVAVAVDNTQTADVEDGTDITSVTDDAGNVYSRLKTFTNGNALIAAGCTCGIFMSQITVDTPNGTNITANFGTLSVAKAIAAFTVDVPPSGTVGAAKTLTRADDSADPSLMTISGLDGLHTILFVHATAHEGPTTDNLTASPNYTTLDNAATTGSPTGSNMGIFWEYRFLDAAFADTVDCSFATLRNEAQVYVALQDPGFDLVLRNPGTNFDINLSAAAASTTIPYQPWLNRAPIQGQ